MDGLVGKNRLKDIWKRIFSAMKIITGDVDFENDGTLQKQIFDLKEKLETPEVIVIDGDTVTPINDVGIWIKCAGIDDTYKYTTLTQVLADNTCMYSLTSDENSMKYLTRSTGFAEELCANENFMTYLGQSAYVDTSLLNSDLWMESICNSSYFEKILEAKVPTMTSDSSEYGNAFCDSVFADTNNMAYLAFDNNSSTEWASRYSDGRDGYIGFKFNNPVCIKKATIISNSAGFQYAKLKASNDNVNWVDLGQTIYNEYNILKHINTTNMNEYSYYRFVIGGYTGGKNRPRATEIQFYGR